jgi:biopolymer transport protein ExbD
MKIRKIINDEDVIMEMNTTPLIDVMLVLLVMLIITIPVQLHSVNLNMPNPSVKQPEVPPQIVLIEIESNGRIYWNGKKIIDESELQSNFALSAQTESQPEIHIRPDQHTLYKDFAHVIAHAQRYNLSKIGVIGSEN